MIRQLINMCKSIRTICFIIDNIKRIFTINQLPFISTFIIIFQRQVIPDMNMNTNRVNNKIL